MFWTKDNGYISTSLIPLVVITFIFYKLCKGAYGDIHENTPIDQFMDGQQFTNCKSALLTSTYENLQANGITRRTSSQVSLSKEDLKNCMQEAIDNNLKDKAMIEYLKDQLDSLVKSDKFKSGSNNEFLQVPQKTVTMTELKYEKDEEKPKTPENNFGAVERIYITAQKDRLTPRFSCLAESELPQIPNYYLDSQYNLPDMTSYLYTPWMPEGFDESLIERSDTKPTDDQDNSTSDNENDGENNNNNNNNAFIKIEDVDVENKKESNKEKNDNIIDINDNDDEDKPLVDNVTLEEIKPRNIAIDVTPRDDDSSGNIYLSLPNTAFTESPIQNETENHDHSNGDDNKDNKPNKRETVYLDLENH
ncbi:hypothetical protein PIROE2DRAFT_13215 [Piromyces sp. E2]|nr:hypothetical protein PIROE2DRAFT_13215 [Piromyces sp. E2]|eukprot:OUM60920.1 hypothetical protein PIROE2DRAFT_13215 [Piromyces sp. E2]